MTVSGRLAVQLLLHMLLLTLPGLPETSSPKKRKRSARKEPKQETLSKEIVEARVQIYMDKLSTWQLIKSLEHLPSPTANATKDGGHDWIQRFFLDVVEPRYELR